MYKIMNLFLLLIISLIAIGCGFDVCEDLYDFEKKSIFFTNKINGYNGTDGNIERLEMPVSLKHNKSININDLFVLVDINGNKINYTSSEFNFNFLNGEYPEDGYLYNQEWFLINFNLRNSTIKENDDVKVIISYVPMIYELNTKNINSSQVTLYPDRSVKPKSIVWC